MHRTFREISLLLLVFSYVLGTEVPKKMLYAGIELEFSEKVRAEIQKHVDFITRNPLAFKSMCEKASIYFPIIREAFTYVGVPEDLMYITIQESGLRGNAVSSSLAVGYWQLKDFTAKEVGLTINSLVDERRHIYRASVGAALYFAKQKIRYDNWLYAVISYYEGGSGAEPYTESKYIGAKKMYLKSLHWYAAKAIAHKIAYEKHIPRIPSRKWLQAKPLVGHISYYTLLKKEKLSQETFKKYNPWLLKNKLPQNYTVSYYVLQENVPYAYAGEPYKDFNASLIAKYRSRYEEKKNFFAEVLPNKKENKQEKKEIPEKKKKRKKNPKPPKNIAVFYVEKEPLYGKEFVILKEGEDLFDIAIRYGKKERKLRRWNGLSRNEPVPVGSYILIVPPKKATIHIVGRFETLHDIALKYKKKVEKLVELNRLKSEKSGLYYGQKIYLKHKKPIDEKLIVYAFDKKEILKFEYRYDLREDKKPHKIHKVKKGETLWSIAKRYKIEINKLRELNNLTNNSVYEGMILIIE